jgi:hypothetical protein
MAIKKSDLYSSLWASCDELRGGMDASQYKDYVLFMLFINYISDKYGDFDDFAPPVVIPKGASFKDMVALKGKDDIGDKINTQVIHPPARRALRGPAARPHRCRRAPRRQSRRPPQENGGAVVTLSKPLNPVPAPPRPTLQSQRSCSSHYRSPLSNCGEIATIKPIEFEGFEKPMRLKS